MQRPKEGDYAPYQISYISLIEGNNPNEAMQKQLIETTKLFSSLPESTGDYSYAAGKWTIKEMLGHIIDTERIMAYRALCIARGEKQILPGFEQDDYVKTANSGKRKIADLLDEYKKVREASITLFKTFDEEMMSRRGKVNTYEVTVNALMYVIPGHEKHHLNILKEKYLNN